MKFWREFCLVCCSIITTKLENINEAILRSMLFSKPQNWAYDFALRRREVAAVKAVDSVETFKQAQELLPKISQTGEAMLSLLRKMIELAKTEEELDQIPSGTRTYWNRKIDSEIETRRNVLRKWPRNGFCEWTKKKPIKRPE
jgi:hypothetical protein